MDFYHLHCRPNRVSIQSSDVKISLLSVDLTGSQILVFIMGRNRKEWPARRIH
jgi:hypothetical protein